MKTILLTLFTLIALSCATTKQNSTAITGIYEVSCGICNFEMSGDECDLAINLDGKYYYVEGSSIDEHGDAHAEDGLCSVVRKANVKGIIKNGVFVAEVFKLVEE